MFCFALWSAALRCPAWPAICGLLLLCPALPALLSACALQACYALSCPAPLLGRAAIICVQCAARCSPRVVAQVVKGQRHISHTAEEDGLAVVLGVL
jgi:hypothetical protein